jgi:glucose-1-phosphate cytidylyltransferase
MRIRTDNQSLPKPMMPIGTRPVLWHVMRYYAHFGHKDFILCLGYGAQAVKDYFLNYQETTSNDFVLMQGGEDLKMLSTDISEWTISFIDTGMDTAIGERLRRVRPYLDGDDMFLANYGDVLTDAPMNDLIEQFAKADAVAQLLAVKPQDSFHVVDIEGDSAVTGISAVASMSMRINGGYFVFRKEIFDYLNEGEDLVMDACIRAAKAGRVRAVQYDGFWAPMDTLKERSALEEQYRRGNSPWALWRERPVDLGRPVTAVEEIDPIIR